MNRPKLTIFLCFVSILVGITALTWLFPYYVDDAFISFRITKNILSGAGPFFNKGESIYTSTSLLYPYFNTIWALVFGGNWIDKVNLINGSLLAMAIGICLYKAQSHVPIKSNWHLVLIFGLLAPWFLDFKTLNYGNSGLETCLYMLIISIFCLPEYQPKPWLSYASWFSIFVRPEGFILGIGRLFEATMVKKTKSFILKSLIFASIALGLWTLIGYLTFGSILPQSILAKQNHLIDRSLEIKKGIGYLFFSNHPFELLICLYSFIAFKDLRKKMGLPVIWSVLYLSFFSFGAAWWPWYFPPLLISFWYLTLISGLKILSEYSNWFLTQPGKYLVPFLFILAFARGFFLIWESTISLQSSSNAFIQRREASQRVGTYLKTKPDNDKYTTLIEPLGLIGWFSEDKKLLDYPGLTKPEMSEFLATLNHKIPHRLTDSATNKAILIRFKPGYIVVWRDEKVIFEKVKTFKTDYLEAKRFSYSPGNLPFDSVFIFKKVMN